MRIFYVCIDSALGALEAWSSHENSDQSHVRRIIEVEEFPKPAYFATLAVVEGQ